MINSFFLNIFNIKNLGILAEEYIDLAITNNNQNADSYYIKGNIDEKKYGFNKALKSYLYALKINPNHKDANSKTAICYGKLNDKYNFCIYANKACDLGDSNACDMVRRFCN